MAFFVFKQIIVGVAQLFSADNCWKHANVSSLAITHLDKDWDATMGIESGGTRYCIFCGEKNDAHEQTCSACGAPLYPTESMLADYLRNEAKDQLKDKAAETVFDKIKAFLLSHLYGIALTVSVIFTAASAMQAFGASSIPRGAVMLTQPPAADALGRLMQADDSTAESEPTVEPEDTAQPNEPQTPDAQAIHGAYQELLPTAEGDFPGYYVYDIDKDGVPELLLTDTDGPNQGLAVHSFGDDGAYYAGTLWGFSNGMPIPASYPDGNGVVLTEIARDYECIWVISKDGTSMTGDVRTAQNSVYEQPLYDITSTYYQNSEDAFGVSVGHQYRTETLAPFFEGSQLLGFNAVSDDTALREALGL